MLRRSRRKILGLGFGLLLSAALGIGGCLSYAEGKESTKSFVAKHMTNSNGTLATYLKESPSVSPEMAAGREALSESLGLWMQAAIAGNDKAAFEKSYETLDRYFTKDQSYIAWKLSPDGSLEVSTNALGDDLRIIGALLEGTGKWKGHPEWRAKAKGLTETLLIHSQKNGYLVDFYDFAREESPDTLALAYVDLSTLKRLVQEEVLHEETYLRYHTLLQDMPDDGVFYPKSFNVVSGEYSYEASVNMIDQLMVAIHTGKTKRDQEALYQFLKQKFKQSGKLFGQYRRADRTAAVKYESPSVYGLAIQFALQQGDRPFAEQLYKRMLTFKGRDSRYPGGYVFEGNTHIFDNLLPLLGEYALKRK